MKVAIYCRVSTDKEDQANSFAAQQQYFRRYIEEHAQWELYEIYADEGVTGTSTKKRTQFNRMMRDAYEGKFHLVITKEVSRFSRNILDTISYTRELRAMGIGVIFANDGIHTLQPEGEMLLSFLASLAQEESRRTSCRVVWGQTRRMEKGVVFGQSLLGYDVKDGNLTINESGAEIVRLIFQKYAVEQVSTSEIARYLREKGYRTLRNSNKWQASTVIKILKNEKYVGDLVQKKTYTPDFLSHEKRTNRGEVPFVTIENHHAPIISREVWNMTQLRLNRNNKHVPGKDGHSNRYAFSGKIQCGQCGNRFVGRFRYRKDGTKIRRWRCSAAGNGGAQRCDVGRLLRDDDAMQMVKMAIKSLPMDFQAMILHVTDLALDAIRVVECGQQEDLRRLQHEIHRLQRKKIAVMDSYFSGVIPREDMHAMNGFYDAQLEQLRHRQNEAELQQGDTPDLKTLGESMQHEVAAILYGETESEIFCKNMVDNLTVFQDRHVELRLALLPQVFHFVEC